MFEQEISNLASMRVFAANVKAAKNDFETALLDNAEYKRLVESAKMFADKVAELEVEIKKAAGEVYAVDGNKNPHPAIAIKIFSAVKILDESAAREWCFANFRPALKMDTRIFEKAVKDKSVPIELATVSDDPRAQIASDLGEHLPS